MSAGDPQAVAEACARAMWAADRASTALGMEITRIAPGAATIVMDVRENMVNGHGTCHGGYIFTLADSAFAFAVNTYDVRTVAQHCTITYLRPARLGDRLTAEAVERTRTGRSGIYDISVRNGEGEVIAEFRGNSRTVGGPVIEQT